MMRGKPPYAGKQRKEIDVCIFKPDRLGDFILASGAIRHLREVFGPGNCALIVADFTVELAEQLFGDSVIIGVPFAHNDLIRGVLPGLLKSRKVFRSYRFRQLFSLRHQRSIYQELLLSHLAVGQSVGIRNETDCLLSSDIGVCEFPLTQAIPYPEHTSQQSCLEIEAHRRTLSLGLGREVPMEQITPRLGFPPLPGAPENLIVVAPFGSTDIRTYPLPFLVRVLKAIQEGRPCRFALSGAPGDAGRLAELLRMAEHAGVRDTSVLPAASFAEFCSTVAQAKGVLSVDTATAHLAVALDKPAGIVLGGGHYGQFGPWRRSDRQVWFTHTMPCFGCLWECPHPEAYCITQIPPEAIASSLLARM
jgi:ADP-heptose:LPS heptosyltransferase